MGNMSLEVERQHNIVDDEIDMDRMGKLQELKRNFNFMSIFGYSVILGSTWEYSLVVIGIPLSNGGTAAAIWMFLITCFGLFFVMLSMAEMASMAPTSGGQYHWVSEMAPRKYQKFMSYLVGWLCAVGWQGAMAGTAYGATQQIQGLIALNLPSYEIKGWHGTLFCIAITTFSIVWNTVLAEKLPLIEGVGMILHVFGFCTFVVVLWVMAPHSDPRVVWTQFEDNSGWESNGLAALVGILGPLVTLIGSDSSCHLSEELTNAAWVLPRAMTTTSTINYIMGFIMTITIMSTLGSDIPAILDTRFGQPWIQVVYNATGSKAGTSVMVAVVAIQLLFCAINQVTTSSRQLFAFARDKGLPFSDFLAKVPPGWNVPVNAVMVTLFCTILLSLIIAGSSIAFNIITSISILGLLASYIVAIACIFHNRVHGHALLPSRFNLGRAGILVNGIALAFLSVAFVFVFFPVVPYPTPESMNWSSLIFGFAVGFSLVFYYVSGRHVYVGPVTSVKQE
ncbi:amino acid transporter [Pleomassaria siparia CBS 279.74]|uniref:Amino acid transporter n=1 Tax=Pleomassaria siparia CBS 279.74 TaxID=1314801 RepID=A0A6G1JT67_9PLEO|nr:amino acid transporter [Pleomassaria siparia CBS 279.74]